MAETEPIVGRTPENEGRKTRADLKQVFCLTFLVPIICLYILTGLSPLITAETYRISPSSAGSSPSLNPYLHAFFLMAWFSAMSAWSLRRGDGLLAGPAGIPVTYFLIAILAGPVIIYGPVALITLLAQNTVSFTSPPALIAAGHIDFHQLTLLFCLIFLAPLAEEMAFRGLLLGALTRYGLPPLAAALISAAAFALIHAQYSLSGLLAVFISGCLYAFLRLWSGSLTMPLIAHISANLFSLSAFWLNPP